MGRPTEDRLAATRAGGITPTGVTSVVAASESEDEARLGVVIDGRYRLDALVGRGGMGVVYRAEHVAIRRTVALKLLHSSLAGIPELRSRFEREANAIGRIEHPNCVNVSDFGSLDDGSLFLVMEFLEGRSLGDLLEREHHLRPRRALRILRHVLAGLGHAHQSGIVHRDIKPDNVILIPAPPPGDGEVAKILDFGIAKVVAGAHPDDDVKLTQAGVAFGTPVYMSPEQALGNPVDGRADLYAASVMAYEMLTGRPPFYSDDKLEVMSMHTTREVPPMNDTLRAQGYTATIPEAVEELILRGLAKRPADRWATAAAYAAALDEVLLDMALDAAPDATPAPLPLPRTHTGTTGAEPLVTTTGSSVIGGVGAAPTVPPGPAAVAAVATVATVDRSMVELVHRRARSRWRWRGAPIWVFAAGAAVALVATFAIVWGASGGDDERAAPSPAATRAQQALDHGDPSGAIKSLEAQKDKIKDDWSAQLQLGNAYAAKRDNGKAVEAYRRAIALDPKAGDDADLRANLRAISDDKDVAAAMDAFTLAIDTLHDATAIDRLCAAASAPGDRARRAGAYVLVKRLGLTRRVDWVAAYGHDLEEGEQCLDRKDAVANLRALGDGRAIPLLEAAIQRKGKVGRSRGKLVNLCLTDDAKAALVYLRSLPAPAEARP